MSTRLELDDTKRAALIRVIRPILDDAYFPMPPRRAPVRAILVRLGAQPADELPPAMRSGLTPLPSTGEALKPW